MTMIYYYVTIILFTNNFNETDYYYQIEFSSNTILFLK